MGLGIVEPAAGFQELRHDLGPAPDVGQPAGGAPAYIYEIERGRPGDRLRRVVEIGADETRTVREPELLRQRRRRPDRGRREVEADHGRPPLRERQRVGAEVALQVEHAEAVDRSELGLLDRVQPAPARAQRREVVARRSEVDADALVPAREVELAPALPVAAGVAAHDTASGAPVSRR
jgi:hypothetical protein